MNKIFFLILIIDTIPFLGKILKKSIIAHPLLVYVKLLSFLVNFITEQVFCTHYFTYMINNHIYLKLKKTIYSTPFSILLYFVATTYLL